MVGMEYARARIGSRADMSGERWKRRGVRSKKPHSMTSRGIWWPEARLANAGGRADGESECQAVVCRDPEWSLSELSCSHFFPGGDFLAFVNAITLPFKHTDIGVVG